MDWTLFASALISATLFPGGSEAILLYQLQQNSSNWPWLLFSAASGNVLGSTITYLMGYGGYNLLQQSRFAIKPQQLQRAERLFARWGSVSLLFAWLPVIGDPLCLLAGMLRLHPGLFLLLVSIGKTGRYLLLIVPFLP